MHVAWTFASEDCFSPGSDQDQSLVKMCLRVLSLSACPWELCCWFHEEGLKENVLLAIRNVSVALSRSHQLDDSGTRSGLQHAEVYREGAAWHVCVYRQPPEA